MPHSWWRHYLQDSGEKDKNSSGRPAWHARPNDDSWRLDRRLTNLHTTSACTVLLGFRISIFTHSARTLSSIRISRAKYLGCSGAFKLHPHVLRVLAFYLGISRLYVTWPHELHLQTLRRCRPITAVYSIWKQHICLVSNTHHLDTWRVSCSPLVTHADSSRVSTAFIRLCVCVCVWFCPHDKTKTAETKTWHRVSSSRHLTHQWILRQKVKSQGHRVNKCKKTRREWSARPEWVICTLSSAQLLVIGLSNLIHFRMTSWPWNWPQNFRS